MAGTERVNTALRIRLTSRAQTVFVCQLLHRSKVGKKYDNLRSSEELNIFNKNVDQANSFLKILSAEHTGVKLLWHFTLL